MSGSSVPSACSTARFSRARAPASRDASATRAPPVPPSPSLVAT
eukprot:CAMPEP_0183347100 /NCGR_PEP_ID=MMETSP0164_2-20130417/12030_1 /TAXON_ID=221442 /ORGANISM="Coccolithus pelagicus ssp braarudi, Strain PLY182g" /LENGTH=43 /DNA_ID= /DNA_START= /DNA_END= /DNA_ORIENTATION=